MATMKLIGMNMPHQKKKMPRLRKTKVGSLNGRTYARYSNDFLLGGKRDVTVKLPKTVSNRIKKAQILRVQPNPTCGMSCVTMAGKITPPSDEAPMIKPKAAPRLARNHVDT